MIPQYDLVGYLCFVLAIHSASLFAFFLVSKYGLDDNTVDFIGHALALHRDDRYLDEPALDTVKRMKVGVVAKCILSSRLVKATLLSNSFFFFFFVFVKFFFYFFIHL